MTGSVVTVGSFDGMHLGHRAVVAEALERARAGGRQAVLVTFEPHPASVLDPRQAPPRLTLGPERREILAELGLDCAVILRFDRALAAMSAEEFVREVLRARYGMRELVLGQDHGFGHGREGDRNSLPALGARLGFGVTVVPPVPDASGQPISSSRIRSALAAGDLRRAAEWLGRPYRISAEVVPGAGRGRSIGVPTVNLAGPLAAKALPPDGVWAARVEWGGGTAGAMLNQGPRPTVGDATRSLEAHLFGFDEDLYGRMVRIEWVERLRDTQKFPSLDALRAQLERDREQALAILARGPWTSTARPTGAR
jgi:riboflavin kinase / FMN adenylyltransferase